MRRLPLLILAALLLFSCSDGGTGRVMDRAEQLLDSCPEQAVALLDSILPTAMRQSVAQRSRFVLLRQKAKHMAWMPLDVDTTLMEAVIWTDRNGTPNERLMANYLLGYGYAEHGWASEAQQAYFRAIEAADTTAKDCDFSRLAKTYAQVANLHQRTSDPQLMLTYAQKSYNYALVAKDDAMISAAYSLLGAAYFEALDLDKSLHYQKIAYKNALSYKDSLHASFIGAEMARIYISNNQLDSANFYIKFFERQNLLNEKPQSKSLLEGYYSLKGQYLESTGHLKDALLYYKKEYQSENLYQQVSACRYLTNAFEQLSLTDSAFYYSEQFILKNAEFERCQNTLDLQCSGIRFLHSQPERIATDYEKKAIQFKEYLIISLLVFLLSTLFLIQLNRRINQKWRKTKEEYINLQKVVEAFNSSKDTPNITIDKIKIIENNISKEKRWLLRSTAIREKNIISTLTEKVLLQKVMTAEETEELSIQIQYFFPEAYNLIQKKRLEFPERQICYLLLAGFKPNQIAKLTSYTKQGISSQRKRLGKKLFGLAIEISSSEFDSMLKNY